MGEGNRTLMIVPLIYARRHCQKWARQSDQRQVREWRPARSGRSSQKRHRPSVNSSVSEIRRDKLKSARDSLIHSAKRSFYPRKQSRNRSIPTLASNDLRRFLHFQALVEIRPSPYTIPASWPWTGPRAVLAASRMKAQKVGHSRDLVRGHPL